MTATPRRVAYVVSRFPRLTETFVLEEMAAVERSGVEVRLHPLQHERAMVLQPDADRWEARARYLPLLSPAIVASNLWLALLRPRRYLGAVAGALAGTWGSLRYFVGAVGFFPQAAHMARLVERDHVDHVHCHFASHPALVGWVVHRLTGLPYSFTAHGSDLHRDQHMLRQKVRDAVVVVAISEHNRDVIEHTCGPSPNVHVIRCGIDLRTFHPPPQPAEERAELHLACVGTLHEVKGQTHLLDACARLASSGQRLHCHLVGDGPDRRALLARAEALGVRPHVTFHGALSAPAVREVLRRVDLLVAPSVPTADGRREGLPVVLMEAMATGLPVVASRLSGIPELVEDGRNGILVEPGDVEGLATAIKRLAADPTLGRRMGAAGRDRVAQDHDGERQAAALVAAWGGATR